MPLDVFGPERAHRLPDDLHPDTEGCTSWAANFIARVARLFFR